jgi:hypothetical protein
MTDQGAAQSAARRRMPETLMRKSISVGLQRQQ